MCAGVVSKFFVLKAESVSRIGRLPGNGACAVDRGIVEDMLDGGSEVSHLENSLSGDFLLNGHRPFIRRCIFAVNVRSCRTVTRLSDAGIRIDGIADVIQRVICAYIADGIAQTTKLAVAIIN